jgi:hypothetical protein
MALEEEGNEKEEKEDLWASPPPRNPKKWTFQIRLIWKSTFSSSYFRSIRGQINHKVVFVFICDF